MIVSESGGANFPQCPTGLKHARCYSVVDLGTRTDVYEGRSNTRRQVVLTFETPLDLINDGGEHDGEPFALSAFYTASLSSKANLRKDLEAWRGREFTPEELKSFDLRVVLGKTCTISVINKKGKSRIDAVLAGQKVQLPPQRNKSISFSLDEFDRTVFESLPEWQKKFIVASPEYKAIASGRPLATGNPADDGGIIDDSDLPF